MKQTDLKPCTCCGKGVMHGGAPVFYRVKIESLGVNVGAIQRQIGLETMLGSSALAFHMGPQEDIATVINTSEAIVCLQCAIEQRLLQIEEKA